MPSLARSCVSRARGPHCHHATIMRRGHPGPQGFIGIAAISPILRKSSLPLPSSLGVRERRSPHSPQLRARRRTNGQTVRALETICVRKRRPGIQVPGCPPPVTRPTRQTEINMTTKIVLALALAMTALASVPASASPHHDWQVAGNCQEDLGYGRTSGWGCG